MPDHSHGTFPGEDRARRAAGDPALNHKRVFRLMAQARLLLQPHVGHRPIRAHEGNVIAPASNRRWSSDVLEIGCWNGEAVRVVFAIDTHDREIIAWQAATGGIDGQMVRDLMLTCVETRFNAMQAPHPVQWLADNGSAYTARDTIDFAAAVGLTACFTPVRSPESNGVSKAFVKTFKRDYARIQPRPDALTVLQCLPGSQIITNTTPIAACECSPQGSSFISNPNQPHVRINGGHSTAFVA